MLIVVDHASNAVPPDIDLDIAPALLARHIAWDIGAEALGRALCDRLGCAGVFGTVSRLVIDLHRPEDAAALIPVQSDGHPVPGNRDADRQARIDRFWHPYHNRLASLIAADRPDLLVAVHSFTPRLETDRGAERPWEVGLLYNQDDRAARFAIAALRQAGVVTGDNQPYSGRNLNYTMDRHAEANGIPYLVFEVRNDLIGDDAGVARWADTLASIIRQVRAALT